MRLDLRLRVTLLPALLLAAGSVSRCELSTDSATGELHISGTVRFRDAGCWVVESEEGRRYALDPAQAPAAVLQDGARVRLTVEPSEDVEGGCGSAMPVDVRRVEALEAP